MKRIYSIFACLSSVLLFCMSAQNAVFSQTMQLNSRVMTRGASTTVFAGGVSANVFTLRFPVAIQPINSKGNITRSESFIFQSQRYRYIDFDKGMDGYVLESALNLISDNSAPQAPSEVWLRAISPASVYIEWSPASDDSGRIKEYRLYRGAALISSLGGTSYADVNLSPATEYSYSVQAIDFSGKISTKTAAQSIKTPPPLHTLLEGDRVVVLDTEEIYSEDYDQLVLRTNGIGYIEDYAPKISNCLNYYPIRLLDIGQSVFVRQSNIKKLGPIAINSGSTFTTSAHITLNLIAPSATAKEVYISESRNCAAGGTWTPFTPSPGQNSVTMPFTLSNEEGVHYISAKYRDATLKETYCQSSFIIRSRSNSNDTKSMKNWLPAQLAMSPASPHRSQSVNFKGFLDYQAQSISFYTNSSCFGAPSVTACKDSFETNGAKITVPQNYSSGIYATIKDRSGAVSQCSPMGSYKNDSVAPVIELSSPTLDSASRINITTKVSPITLKGLCKGIEDGQLIKFGGLAKLKDSQGMAIPFIATACQAGQWSIDLNFSNVPNGEGVILAQSQDLATNISNRLSIKYYKSTIDNTPATLAVQSPISGDYINYTRDRGLLNISGVCSENGRSVTISGDIQKTSSCINGRFNTTADLSQLPNQNYNFTASIDDISGNTTTTAPITVKLDNSLPVIKNFSLNSGTAYTNKPDSTLYLDVLGADEMAITTNANCGGNLTWKPFNLIEAFNLQMISNPQTVYAKFRDFAGNSSECISVTATLDVTPPTVTISSPADNLKLTSSNIASQTFSGTCSEAGVAVDLAGFVIAHPLCSATGTWAYTTTTLKNIEDGDIVVTVNQTDRAGNKAWTDSAQAVKRTLKKYMGAPRNPTIAVNDGATSVNALTVKLNLFADDSNQMKISLNKTDCSTGTWEPYSTTKENITLVPSSGKVKASVRYRNPNTTQSACVYFSIPYNVPTASGGTLRVSTEDGEEILSSNSVNLKLTATDQPIQMAITENANCQGLTEASWMTFSDKLLLKDKLQTFQLSNGLYQNKPIPALKKNALNTFYVQARKSTTQLSNCEQINLYVLALPPSDLIYEASPVVYNAGSPEVVNLLPKNSGGVVKKYSITPAAPSGFSFDSKTGKLTVIPGKSIPAGEDNKVFEVTASNDWGTSEATSIRFYRKNNEGQLSVFSATEQIQNDSLTLVKFQTVDQYSTTPNEMVFKLKNTGTKALRLGKPRMQYLNSAIAGYKIVSAPAENFLLDANAETTMTVRLQTISSGIFQDVIQIPTNDSRFSGIFSVRVIGEVREVNDWNPIVDIFDLFNSDDASQVKFQGSSGRNMVYFGKVKAGSPKITKYFHAVDNQVAGNLNTQYYVGAWSPTWLDENGNAVSRPPEFNYTFNCNTVNSSWCANEWNPIPPPTTAIFPCGDIKYSAYKPGYTPGSYNFPITFTPPSDPTASGRYHTFMVFAISWRDSLPSTDRYCGVAAGTPHVRVIVVPLVADIIPTSPTESADAKWITIAGNIATKYGAEAERLEKILNANDFAREISNNSLLKTDYEKEILTGLNAQPRAAELKALLMTHLRAEMSVGAAEHLDSLVQNSETYSHEAFVSIRNVLESSAMTTNDEIGFRRSLLVRLMTYLRGAETEVRSFTSAAILAPTIALPVTVYNAMSSKQRDLYKAALHRAFLSTLPTDEEVLDITTKAIDQTQSRSLKTLLINQTVTYNPALMSHYLADRDVLVIQQGGQ